jgi:hypothetical protein
MKKSALLPFVVLGLAGCVTNSKVITEPPGVSVWLNGKEFGSSPADVQSVGTTFGEYTLELKDQSGNTLHRQNLPKNFRIWGLFWPPYGVFYNLFEMYPQYRVQQVTTASGSTAWSLAPGI